MLPPIRRVKAFWHRPLKLSMQALRVQLRATRPKAIKPPVLPRYLANTIPIGLHHDLPCAHDEIEEALYSQPAARAV